jgi:hypothetical protein
VIPPSPVGVAVDLAGVCGADGVADDLCTRRAEVLHAE